MEETAAAVRTYCVIDDDASVRKALQRLIRATGMKTNTYASSHDFLADERTLDPSNPPPDCLVIDVRMPDMSGLELQQRLIADGRRIPIVFITAHDDECAREKALDAGASDWLQKPFDDHQLLNAIDGAISAHGAAKSRIRTAR